MKKTLQEIINILKKQRNKYNIEGMARFGISSKNILGVRKPVLRKMAKEQGKDHRLALDLWASGIHEARILACLIGEPCEMTERQMEDWVGEFDSWDVCDQCCGNLFDKTSFAYRKAEEWAGRDEEFVKRAGFVLMAELAVHDKKAGDEQFFSFLNIIKREANDERNYVRKAVNWALRQIGKRNRRLNHRASKAAEEIQALESKAARWVAADALRELRGDTVQRILLRREKKQQ
jgi:3-methyladenine DNA glycosylase AlkD